jgi:hypothetical protein
MLYPTELPANLSISKAGLEPATLRVIGDNPRASARTKLLSSMRTSFAVDIFGVFLSRLQIRLATHLSGFEPASPVP